MESPAPPEPHSDRIECAALALPWLVNLALIVWLGNEVPWWDDWEGIDWWLRVRGDGLDLAALWAPHNEHRVVLQRLLFHVALQSGVGLKPLMLLSHLLLGATLWLLAPLIRGALAGLPPRQRIWTLVAFSAFVLSWVQWLNVLVAFQVSFTGALLGIVMAVRGMTDAPGRVARWRLGAGIALAYLSSAPWLVLIPLLLTWQGLRLFDTSGSTFRRRSLLRFGGLAVTLGTMLILSLVGLRSTLPSSLPSAARPVAVAKFLLRLYGSPFTASAAEPWMGIGMAMGALFAVGSVIMAVAAWKRRSGEVPLPALGIATLALTHGASLLIALGRAAHGGEAALASRYASFILPGWAALLALTIWDCRRQVQAPDIALTKASRLAPVLVLGILGGGILVGAAKLYRVATVRQPQLVVAGGCLRDVLADPSRLPNHRACLAPLYPDVDRLVAIARRQADAAASRDDHETSRLKAPAAPSSAQ